MSLVLTFGIEESNSCKNLIFNETTRAYSASNTSGWGSPNAEIADVVGATLTITKPDTTRVILDLYDTFPTVDKTIEETITQTDLEIETKIVDGQYTFVYSVEFPDPRLGTTFALSTDAVAGGVVYTWSVPTGATINSGQGTTAINISIGSECEGDITVTVYNSGGDIIALVTVTTIESSFSTQTIRKLLFCNISCCVAGLWAKAVPIMGCTDCSSKAQDKAERAQILLNILEGLAECGQEDLFTNTLALLNKICNSKTCSSC